MTAARLFDSVPVKLGAFAVVLVVVFVVALGIGSAVGPVDDADQVTTTTAGHETGGTHDEDHGA